MTDIPNGRTANHYANDVRIDDDVDDAIVVATMAKAFGVPSGDVAIARASRPLLRENLGASVRVGVYRLPGREPMPMVLAVNATFAGDRNEREIVNAIAAGLDREIFVRLHEAASGVHAYMVFPSGHHMWIGHFLDRMELADGESWPDYLDEDGPITMILPGTPVREDMDAIAAMEREGDDA